MQDTLTNYVILGMLNHQPMTGYDIKKRIKQTVGHFWNAGFGQIYPALKRLKSQGQVAMEVVRGDKSPDRKVYSITEAGQVALLVWLRKPAGREYARYEILLKLFFGSGLGPEGNLATIQAFRDRSQKVYATMLAFEKDLRGLLADSPDHLYYLLTVLFGKKVYAAYLEWADEAADLLKNAKSDFRRKTL